MWCVNAITSAGTSIIGIFDAMKSARYWADSQRAKGFLVYVWEL